MLSPYKEITGITWRPTGSPLWDGVHPNDGTGGTPVVPGSGVWQNAPGGKGVYLFGHDHLEAVVASSYSFSFLGVGLDIEL
jgi:hypothetical protein